MDKARTGRPWRSWTAIAFVLLTLALIQACDSGKHTGPSTNSSVQLRLKQASGAELPAGCTGTYSVSGPGANIQNAALPGNGQISFQGQIGQTYTISVSVTCGQALRVKLAQGGARTGSTTITLGTGNNEATIVLTLTADVSVKCSPNPVDLSKDPKATSTCTCNFQSAGPPTITWSGANQNADPKQATFNSTDSGDVSCTVNGIASNPVHVNVINPSAPAPPPPPVVPPPPVTPPPTTGNIQIFNDTPPPLLLKRRGFAQTPLELFTRVIGVPNTNRTIPAGSSATVSTPAGLQQVEASRCDDFTQDVRTKPVPVTAGQTSSVHFNIISEEISSCD